jgi:hypothetical protein
VLEKDYKDRVQKDQAELYFQLTPEACGRRNWNEEVAAFLAKHPCQDQPKRHKTKKARREIGEPPAGEANSETKVVGLPSQEDLAA